MKKSQLIKQAFDPFCEMPLKIWEPLAETAELIFVEKESVIKEADKTEKHVNLILKGSAAILFWRDDQFICTDMLIENEFACEYLSFITQKPTPFEVRSMEDSEMLRISYKAFEKFTNENPHGDTIWRYALQALYIDKLLQQQQLLTMTATQRYTLMLEHHGFIVNRIPQKYIASYLGVTQQSLSRMRRNIK